MIWIWLLAACGPGQRLEVDPARHVDVNGDGYADIVTSDATNDLAVWYGGSGMPGDAPDRAELVDGAFFFAGDVDADGISDGILANGEESRLHWGSPDGLDLTPAQTVAGGAGETDVHYAGDVDCDGHSDMLIAGTLYYGGPDGYDLESTWSWERSGRSGQTGGVGDVDGDGCDDLLIESVLHHGGPDGPVASAVVVENLYPTALGFDLDDNGLADVFGNGEWWTAAAGVDTTQQHTLAPFRAVPDLNGDGKTDVVGTGDQLGAVWGYLGGSDDPRQDEPRFSGPSPENASGFGHRHGGIGDFDGDGFGDFVVLAPEAEKVFLYRGGRVMSGDPWFGRDFASRHLMAP